MMKTNFNRIALLIIIGELLLSNLTGVVYGQDPVDYVNPNIGTIGHLLKATIPDVQLPRGMIRLFPHTTPGIRDVYLADKIYSFSVTSLSNDFSGGLGIFSLMPVTGNIKVNEGENASGFDHDLEKATPYCYTVLLEDYDIDVEYTVTEHSAYYRFTFPEEVNSNILLRLLQNAEMKIVNNSIIEGYQTYSGDRNSERKLYFHSEFSKPFKSYGSWTGKEVVPGEKEKTGNNIGIFTTWSTSKGEQVQVKVGFSFISIDQARQNLENEISDWDFDRVKNSGREIWNKALSKIRIEGGTESQRAIFYTGLYRVLGRKTTNITEYGKYYSSFDNKVHLTDGHDFYQLGESWGSFRSLFPLGLILEPERQNDIVRSYLRMYEQRGWLGDAALDRRVMIGRHETATITEAYMKGFRDFDVGKVYEGMKKNAMKATMIPWRNGPATELDTVYFEKGFFPALALGQKEWVPQVDNFEKRQAVSVTLEHSYDDWCLAQMAKSLNKQADYDFFMKRSYNFKNLFDTRIGFMAPKTADGKWVFNEEKLDPIWSGGQGGRDYYTETNAWTYTFHVQHDVAGLIDLMGGRDKFIAKLDALFQEQFGRRGSKVDFLKQFPDGTGLIGQYNHGNQPGFHISYLYNYAGEPWKTQRRVRDIMKIWYNDGPLGICGDEDEGELSSWYVFSAMGFYPVCPGRAVYDIGSPIFEKVAIDVGNGKTFNIEARDVSSKNKYIQSAHLNGEPLNSPWFNHSDLSKGGTLVLQMGPRPNVEWGRTPETSPSSLSR
ncbi:MAG TPA: GH92 family glycosyl hydrolase [Prolixibacteraceae bacterium]